MWLIDVGVPDENVGGMLRTRIGMDKLREVAAVNWKPLPRDHGRLAALEASYSYLRQFTPHVLSTIDFQGRPRTAELMDAVHPGGLGGTWLSSWVSTKWSDPVFMNVMIGFSWTIWQPRMSR